MVNVHCALFIDDERKTRSHQSVSEASGVILIMPAACCYMVCAALILSVLTRLKYLVKVRKGREKL